MRKLLTTSVAAVTLGTFMVANAHAADLYTPPPVYAPPPPVWSWTGPYAGLHVGTVDGDVDYDYEVGEGLPGVPPQAEGTIVMDPNGIMGGLQAGYNFQFNSIVLGVEGDISFGDVDDVIYPTIDDVGARVESQMDWMATIRARLGWAWDRTLFYATGGVAFTELKIKVDVPGDFNDSDKNWMTGWTVGGGVEHAWTDDISFKAEYLYADFGNKTFDLCCSDGVFEMSGKADLTTHTFRVGVNWLF